MGGDKKHVFSFTWPYLMSKCFKYTGLNTSTIFSIIHHSQGILLLVCSQQYPKITFKYLKNLHLSKKMAH